MIYIMGPLNSKGQGAEEMAGGGGGGLSDLMTLL